MSGKIIKISFFDELGNNIPSSFNEKFHQIDLKISYGKVI